MILKRANFDLWRFSHKLSIWFWSIIAHSCYMRFFHEFLFTKCFYLLKYASYLLSYHFFSCIYYWVNTMDEWLEESMPLWGGTVIIHVCAIWSHILLVHAMIHAYEALQLRFSFKCSNLKVMHAKESETNHLRVLVV